MSTRYQPLEDRLLVKEIKKGTEMTDGGIHIPETIKKEVKEGIVISVGPGRYASESGMAIPTILAKGDHVLYGASQGMPIEIEGDAGKVEVTLLRESDVLLVISKKSAE